MVSKTLLNNQEAVFIALRLFAFDLRDSPDPYKDLITLNKARKEEKNFIISENRQDLFARNLFQNKNYYCLDRYYKEDLKAFYNKNSFNELYQEYSIEDKDINKLEKIYNNNNFHRGWLRGQDYRYDITNYKRAISFGIPGKKIINFEIEDLIDFFKTKGNRDPITMEKLNEDQIKVLQNLCKKQNYILLEESLIRKELKDNSDIISFSNKYLFASDLIDKILDDIFRIGMFIRGWRISGNNSGLVYPLKRSDCVDYYERKEEINENVIRVTRDLNYNINRIKDPSITKILKNLPLVDYVAEEFSYYKEEGQINDLIISLDDLNNKNIKVLSNQFLLAAYYYTFSTSGKKLFSINSLELL